MLNPVSRLLRQAGDKWEIYCLDFLLRLDSLSLLLIDSDVCAVRELMLQKKRSSLILGMANI